MFRAEIKSLSEINHIAARFIQAHPADRIFAFYGDMGVGKTTFIKALCEEMHVLDYVTSPTIQEILDAPVDIQRETVKSPSTPFSRPSLGLPVSG